MLTAEGIDINRSLAHTKVMFYEVVPVEIDSTAEACFFRKVTGGFFVFFLVVRNKPAKTSPMTLALLQRVWRYD